MQIITIVENNHITGVVYGTVEVHDEKILKQKHLKAYNNAIAQAKQRQHKTNTKQK